MARTFVDPLGNRQRSVPLTFGRSLCILHSTNGTRRYVVASKHSSRVREWTREEAKQYSRRIVEQRVG